LTSSKNVSAVIVKCEKNTQLSTFTYFFHSTVN